MKKLLSILLLPTLLSAGMEDTAFRGRVLIKKSLCKTWSAEFLTETEWDQNVSKFSYHFDQLLFVQEAPSDWFIGFGVRETVQRDGDDFATSPDAVFQLIKKWTVNADKWDFRTQLQCREITRDALLRYRIRTVLDRGITRFDLHPTFWNELFFKDGHTLLENRVAAGLIKKISSNIDIRLDYDIRIRKMGASWRTSNLIEFETALSF